MAYAAAVTGAFKLLACAVCRDEEEFYDFLTTRVGSLRAVDRVETSPIIRTLKQSSTVLGVGGASLSTPTRAPPPRRRYPRLPGAFSGISTDYAPHRHRRPGRGTSSVTADPARVSVTAGPARVSVTAGPARLSRPTPARRQRPHPAHIHAVLAATTPCTGNPSAAGSLHIPILQKNPADPRPACRAVTG